MRGRAVACILAVLATGAARGAASDDCGGGPVPDRMAELAAAVQEALESAATPSEARRFSRVRDALALRSISLPSRTQALRAAAVALDRMPGWPLYDELWDACDALRGDVDRETLDLDRQRTVLPDSIWPRTRARLDALATRVVAALAVGRSARAAGDLHRAARILERAREPRVAIFGGPFRVVSVDVEGVNSVPLNRVVVIRFSDRVDPSSVRADTVAIRRGPNFTVQVPGTYQALGCLVLFRPRFPTDPALSDAGFLPDLVHRVAVAGFPSTVSVRDLRGNRVSAPYAVEFRTESDPRFYFSPAYFGDAPPARVLCTVPGDALPAAPWTDPGGSKEVPTSTPIRLLLNRVPLQASSVAPPAVELVVTSLRGEPAELRVPGRVVLEQELGSVSLSFVPSAPLPDRSRFVLRAASGVVDLAGLLPLADHEGRAALFAAAAAEYAEDPTGPLASLAAAHPFEVDARTYLVFTTRDEAPQDVNFTLTFDGTDEDVDGGDGADRALTSASFDQAVPGAVVARHLVSGGTGRLGVFDPPASVVLDSDSPEAPGGVFDFQRIHVRPGVTVVVRGSRPAILRAVEGVIVHGEIRANGLDGDLAEIVQTSAELPVGYGGAGGPGGGAGGDSFPGPEQGLRGESGEDVPDGGGGGEGGGESPAGASSSTPGGGGGGGHGTEGVAGTAGIYVSGESGPGGAGGAAGGTPPSSAATDGGRDLSRMGGGGGGAGGNGRSSTGARTSGAGGGGGGGAILLSTSGDILVSGIIAAAGGWGGNTTTGGLGAGVTRTAGAPGGGGAGGSIACYAEGSLDVTGAYFDVRGGREGLAIGGLISFLVGLGGRGGEGFVALEDEDGAPAGLHGSTTPSAGLSTGVYDATSRSGDDPSVFTGTWFQLPALLPTVLPFMPTDFAQSSIPGSETTWEIQMARADALQPDRPDLGALDPRTGESSDPGRASPWVLLSDGSGIRDVDAALNGRGYQYFRIRVSFRLPDGVRRNDPMPRVESFRVRLRHQD